ncbi:MAG: hypothetical protein AAF748_15625 [Pseudomonadota bacterium]
MEEKVGCRTPAEGRDGVTNIPKWKFDTLRAAILDALGSGPVAFKDLRSLVEARIDPEALARLGSLGWHTTCVKLELEVRGEIIRLPGKSPQQIARAIP